MVSMGVSRSKTVDVIWCFPPFIEWHVWLTLVPFKSLSGQIRIIYSSYSYWKFKNSNFNISVKVHCGFLLHIQWSTFSPYIENHNIFLIVYLILGLKAGFRPYRWERDMPIAYLVSTDGEWHTITSTVPLYYFRILLPSWYCWNWGLDSRIFLPLETVLHDANIF